MAQSDGGAAAPAASDGEGGGPTSGVAGGETGATLTMHPDTLGLLTNLLAASQGRMERLRAILTAAKPDPAVAAMEVPDEILVGFADLANTIAESVTPYVVSEGMIGEEAEKGDGAGGAGSVAKAALAWTQEYIDTLSDWCFLYVEPSTTHDNDWRTIPLSARHFPVRDHAGRLSLPAVIDAIEQIKTATQPWLSEPRKKSMLLRLAEERLCEVAIVVRREPVVPPEAAAELAAIAELIASTCPIAGASPSAPAAPPPAAGQPAAPVTQALSDVMTKAVANIRAIRVAKNETVAGAAGAPPCDVVAMAAACAQLKAAITMVEGAMSPEVKAAPAAAPPPFAPGDSAAAAKVDELAKAVSETRIEIAKAKADLDAAKTRIAKMARQVPASAVVQDDRTEVVTKARSLNPPLMSDMNELANKDEAQAAAR